MTVRLQKRAGGNTVVVWFSEGNTGTEISLFGMYSTGLKPTIRGDQMAAKRGVRHRFTKLYVDVDVKTEKIYAAVITDDKCVDSLQLGTGRAGFCKCRKDTKHGYLCRHGSRSRRRV